jgi:broad specificity phosphatase PhoE
LKRAADTAKEIAKYHKNTPLILTKDLRENYLGSFEGKRWETIDWKKYDSYKDVESVKNIRKRAKSILDRAYKNHKNDTVLFVGHNAINKQLIGLIMGLKKNGIKKIKQSNTAVSIFEISENKKHKVHCLNCTKHL